MSPSIDPEDLAQLGDYECPECGPLVEDGETWVHPGDVLGVLGGDDAGYTRCPECGAELEQTVEAALDMLAMIAERHPDMAAAIGEAVARALVREDE